MQALPAARPAARSRSLSADAPAGARPAASGSTLQSTWADPRGTGELHPAGGAGLIERTDLAPRAPIASVLATLAHLTDAHVLDAQSPARVTFLDRLGPPFTSTFRPHETLTAQVLDGAVRAIDALAPDAVIQGGDLIDNAQANELAWALAVLRGGAVDPDSGASGYFGVQWAGRRRPVLLPPGRRRAAPSGNARGRDECLRHAGTATPAGIRCWATTTCSSRACSRRRP